MINSHISVILSCNIKKVWGIITNNISYNWRTDILKIATKKWLMNILAKPYLKKQQERYIKDLKNKLLNEGEIL